MHHHARVTPIRGESAEENSEVHGIADGAPLLHKSGIVLLKRRFGMNRVSQQELLNVLRALEQLPASDLAEIARHNIPILLVPTGGLEDSLLGATTIVQATAAAPWKPTLVRIAVNAHDRHDPTGEIVQHELGHVISVLRRQDRTEDAAEAYAKRY